MAAAATNSPSSSSSSSNSYPINATANNNTAITNPNPNPNPNSMAMVAANPMQSWWESISKARSRIHSLSDLLSLPSLSSLADSERPAASLLSSSASYSALSSALSHPSSGSGDDPLCHWLYDTFLSSDPDLRLVVLSFLPLLVGLYLSRLHASDTSPFPPSLAGFESVLLTVYHSETRSRGGKPLLISVPDLSLPSLYHSPRPPRAPSSQHPHPHPNPRTAVLFPALEPQTAVKSTKRPCIIAVALDCYYRKISLMPPRSKADFCEFVVAWAGQDCSCRYELDDGHGDRLSNHDEEEANGITSNCNGRDSNSHSDSKKGCRVPLPWELMQPILRILGHCLLAPRNPQEVKDAASVAVRSLYARALHDLVPQAILASRSLIQLDKGSRKTSKDNVGMLVAGGTVSNPTTPSKPKKPEMLLVSK